MISHFSPWSYSSTTLSSRSLKAPCILKLGLKREHLGRQLWVGCLQRRIILLGSLQLEFGLFQHLLSIIKWFFHYTVVAFSLVQGIMQERQERLSTKNKLEWPPETGWTWDDQSFPCQRGWCIAIWHHYQKIGYPKQRKIHLHSR